ncbi:MAG: tyrosine-protein phosphatase [Pseudomonadota bacterium]
METGSVESAKPIHPMQRHLDLEGCPNFRDAGGYETKAGPLGWRRLFRSGHLADVSEAGRASLARLGIELVIDLRRADERKLEPSTLAGAKLITAEITPGSQASAIYADSTKLGGAAEMHRFMCEINREFVTSQTSVFARLYEELLDSGAKRVLFHCSAGKDRTGFAIAMLQLALGVAKEDVERDYLLSAKYYLPEEHMARVRKKYPVDHLSDEDLRPMLETNGEYLRTAFAAIESAYGSIAKYLVAGLGLTPTEQARLRELFLA